MLANPAQYVETGFLGEVQVEEDERGQRMLATVGERTVAGEVIYGLGAVHSDVDRIRQARAREGNAKEKDVGWFVFNIEDGGLANHCGRSGEGFEVGLVVGRLQFDPEAAAVAGLGLDADLAVHSVHHLADQGKTDAGPLVALVKLLEHLPDFVVVSLLDADAFIFEPDANQVAEGCSVLRSRTAEGGGLRVEEWTRVAYCVLRIACCVLRVACPVG